MQENRDQWLAWRQGGIGGTDIAKAVTGAYGGAYSVVAEKLGRLTENIDPALAERGHRWEQPIADAVQHVVGRYVVGEQTWCEAATNPRHRCTVDGFLARNSEASINDLTELVEIKTTGRGRSQQWERWTIQVQWQMWVTGMARALIAAAEIDDTDDSLRALTLRWVERDDAMIDVLRRQADWLLGHIDAGTLLEPDAGALDAVAAVHAEADEDAETVDLDDIADLLARHHDLGEQLDELAEQRDTISAIVRDRIGAATKGRATGWRVSVSRPSRILTDDGARALLAEHPDLGQIVVDKTAAKTRGIYDAFTSPVGARRLTITPATKGTKGKNQ